MDIETKIIEHLTSLIKIKSYLDKNTDEREAIKYVFSFLKKLREKDSQINIELQTVEGERKNIIVTKGKPKVLLEFHMDTVPPGDLSFWKQTKPFEPKIIEGAVYGRGSCDMKGSIATILTVLESLVEERKFNNVAILFDVDEEYEFNGVKKFIQETKLKPELIICGEPTDLKISNKHRGFVEIEVITFGISAHAGRSKEGVNAIELLVSALKKASEEITSEKYEDDELGTAAFNLAFIKGGVEGSYNSVPSQATAIIDLRPTPKLTEEKIRSIIESEIKSEIKKIVEENKDKIKKSFDQVYKNPVINFRQNYQALFCSKEQISQFLKIHKKHVSNQELTMNFGFTEAGILSNFFKIPAFNFGPGPRATLHTSEEHVNISDLLIVYEVLKEYLEFLD